MEQCKHHEAFERTAVDKDTLIHCQKQSRDRFWSVAVACIGIIVIGFISGTLLLGECASETSVTNLERQVTRTSESISNLARIVDTYINESKARNRAQDEKIYNLELENARRSYGFHTKPGRPLGPEK